MSIQIDNVQQAVRNLADIRRAISRAEVDSGKSGLPPRSDLHLMLHIVLFALAGGLLALELVHSPTPTQVLYLSHFSWTARFIWVGSIALCVVGLVVALYVAVWRAARRSEELFEDFIARNFVYLRNLSFLSDLYMKFVLLSVVILAGRPDWVSSLLIMCIGDYLLQGRVFVLPWRLAFCLGVLCFLFGGVQLLFLQGTLWYALIAFLIVTGTSLSFIAKARREARQRDTRA